MIEELVARSFALRDSVHLAHWATRSFAEHMALGEFYDEIIEHIDSTIEVYQGCYGLLKEVKPLSYSKDNILNQIVDEANWIAENRDAIAKNNQVIENQLDELGAFYASTAYKLKFLS